WQPGKLAEVHRGFRMTGAHEHPALTRNQWKYMPGPHEVARTGIRIGEIAHCKRPVLGGNPGGGAMLEIDANGEGRMVRRVVLRHHGLEIEPLRLLARHGRADDAGGVAH